MLFAKLLLSPLPHARIRRIDTSAALAMPGVLAIITGEDVPKPQQPMQLGEAAAQRANTLPEVALASASRCIRASRSLAVAAIDEVTAADAIEKIKVEYEPLPWVVDPIVTLRPGGPNPRAEGNVWRPPQVTTFKISEASRRPSSTRAACRCSKTRRSGGRSATSMRASRTPISILDETLVHQSTGHQPMEPRTAMAYWQNGKLYLHGSTQSVARTVANVAQWVDIPQDQVVVISEYTRRRIRRQDSRRADDGDSRAAVEEDRPSGDDAHQRAKKRTTSAARVRAFICARRSASARTAASSAMDLCAIGDCGPYCESGRRRHARDRTRRRSTIPKASGSAASACSPTRRRACRSARRAASRPSAMLEPMISKAARQLGVDQVEIRKINAPVTGIAIRTASAGAAGRGAAAARRRRCSGPPPRLGAGSRSSRARHLREALDQGAAALQLGRAQVRATASGAARRSRASAWVSAPTRPDRSRWMACSSSASDGKALRAPGHRQPRHRVGAWTRARIVAEELGIPVGADRSRLGQYRRSTWRGALRRRAARRFTRTRARISRRRRTSRRSCRRLRRVELGGRPESYTVANERVSSRGVADLRAGGRSGDQARRTSSTAMRCRTTSTT